jgi:AcrR family transcriptional regulator
MTPSTLSKLRPARTSAETRDHILAVCSELFDRHGVHGVGMDRIVNECNVGKMTLYRQYPSKDDLVVAYLERRSRVWWDAVEAAEAAKRDPYGQLMALIDAVEREASQPGHPGCPFLRASGEFPDDTHPARLVCSDHVAAIRLHLIKLTTSAHLQRPRILADQLLALLEGVLASSAVLGEAGPARHAAALAKTLVMGARKPTAPAHRR